MNLYNMLFPFLWICQLYGGHVCVVCFDIFHFIFWLDRLKICKAVIVGDVAVGKTCLVNR